MKIFVTGASGYLGGRLATRLADEGHTVHALVRNPARCRLANHPNILLFEGDLSQRGVIDQAIRGCDQAYHIAAMVKLWSRRRSDFYQTNVEGTRHVLESAESNGVRKLVFTSTCAVIGPSLKAPMTEEDPRVRSFENDYEFSKFLAENLVREFGRERLSSVIVSVPKLFGPGDVTSAVSVNGLIRRFISGQLTFCPAPESLLSNYGFTDDVVEGHLAAMESGRSGEKYIIGGENLSYTDFFNTLRDFTRRPGRVLPVGKLVGFLYGSGHFLHSWLRRREPEFTGKGVGHIYCNKAFSCEKAIAELGYRITPFREAANKTIRFLGNQ